MIKENWSNMFLIAYTMGNVDYMIWYQLRFQKVNLLWLIWLGFYSHSSEYHLRKNMAGNELRIDNVKNV